MPDPIWPQPLQPVSGPYPENKLRGVAEGMGDAAPATLALIETGLLSPDMMTQFTLYLLARQPRSPRKSKTAASNTSETIDASDTSKAAKGAPGVAGRIWAREQVTYHCPVASAEPFVIEGASTGRHVRKGRRYATTACATVDREGRRIGTNLTTGLLAYRVDEGLADSVEGQPLEDTETPRPDWDTAPNNPHLDALAAAEVGEVLGGHPLVMSLAMMAARDTDDPDNPIHSDPKVARAAGLAKPIAGGSHVQAFALELLMARFGPQVLLHGTHVDTRWKAPTEADVSITPRAEITAVEKDRVEATIEVRLTRGPVAMAGRLVIPRPA